MDPYNSIPHDHSRQVRKRVRDRDESDTQASPTKRARADTLALIETTDDLPLLQQPPPPEANIAGYTRDRLRAGLRAVQHAAQRRDITPRTATFLALHKDAYKVALRQESPSEAACAVVQSLDNVLHSEAFTFSRQDPETAKAMDTILRLRRLELMATYGDYVGQNLQHLRADLKEAARGGSPQLQKANSAFAAPQTWVEIGDSLLETNVDHMKRNLVVACSVLGVNEPHMTWLIAEWRRRNRQFYNGIREDIKHCDWSSLAKNIHRDLTELTQIEVDQDILDHYAKAIVDVRDTFFLDAANVRPVLWRPNQYAQALTEERIEKERRKATK